MKNILIIGTLAIIIFVGGWYVWNNYYCQAPDMHQKGMIMNNGTGNMMMEDNKTMQTDEIVTCPVMGTKMSPAKAYSKMEYKGKMYYFCCPACEPAFKKNPEKYIKE